MAVSRLTQTTLQNGFEKYNQLWDGRSAVGSMEAISSITLSAAQSSIEFNNIPQTYTHLQLRAFLRQTSTQGCLITFNGSTSSYRSHYLEGTGTQVISGTTTDAGIAVYPMISTASIFSSCIWDILDYSNTNKNKVLRALNGYDGNGSGYIDLDSGVWINTAAITSIKVECTGGTTWTQFSSFSLYGIK